MTKFSKEIRGIHDIRKNSPLREYQRCNPLCLKDENVWPLIILLPSNFPLFYKWKKILYCIVDIHGEVNFFLYHEFYVSLSRIWSLFPSTYPSH